MTDRPCSEKGTTGPVKRPTIQPTNFFLYDFSHDFVLNDLDDFAVEKNDPGVGQGPARLKLS